MNVFRLAALALFFSACSHAGLAPVKVAGKKLHGGLALVSADTPYFLTTVDPLPDAAVKALMERGAQALATQKDLMANLKGLDIKNRKILTLFMTKAGEVYGKGGTEKFGMSTHAKMMIYGLGLRPVMRMQLADTKRFDALLLDLLAQAEVTWEASRHEKQVIRTIKTGAKKLVFVQLYHQGDLVVTVARPEEVKDVLPWLIGTKRPAKSLASSARLSSLLSGITTGKTRYMVGDMSFARLVELAGFAEHDAPNLLAEIRDSKSFMKTDRHRMRLFASMFGTSQLVAEVDPALRFVTQFKQGLAPTLAPYLKGLPAHVPGPELGAKSLLSFSLGLNLGEFEKMLSAGVKAHLETKEKAGWVMTKETLQATRKHRAAVQVEKFQDATAESGSSPAEIERKLVSKPLIKPMKPGSIPAIAKVQRGLSVTLMGLNLDNPSPLSMLGSLRIAVVVGSENPGALVAMAMGHPKLAGLLQGLEIPANSTPVSLDGRVPLPGLSIMRSEKALALAFGGGVADQVSSWLKAEPQANPSIFSTTIDGGFMSRAMLTAVKQIEARMPAKPGLQGKAAKGGSEALKAAAKSLESAGTIHYNLRVIDSTLVLELDQGLAAAPAND